MLRKRQKNQKSATLSSIKAKHPLIDNTMIFYQNAEDAKNSIRGVTSCTFDLEYVMQLDEKDRNHLWVKMKIPQTNSYTVISYNQLQTWKERTLTNQLNEFDLSKSEVNARNLFCKRGMSSNRDHVTAWNIAKLQHKVDVAFKETGASNKNTVSNVKQKQLVQQFFKEYGSPNTLFSNSFWKGKSVKHISFKQILNHAMKAHESDGYSGNRTEQTLIKLMGEQSFSNIKKRWQYCNDLEKQHERDQKIAYQKYTEDQPGRKQYLQKAQDTLHSLEKHRELLNTDMLTVFDSKNTVKSLESVKSHFKTSSQVTTKLQSKNIDHEQSKQEKSGLHSSSAMLSHVASDKYDSDQTDDYSSSNSYDSSNSY